MQQYLQLPLNGTASQYDAVLSTMITQVSRRIEWDCQRTFGATDWVEFQNTGTRQQRAQVRNKPVIQINSVRWGYASAIQLTYSGSAIFAAVQVTPGRKVILQQNNSNGTTTNNSFDLLDTTNAYQTCSQLVTGINAVTGFSSQLYGQIDVPTKWLFAQTGLTVKGANSNFTQSLGWPCVDIFGYIIDPLYGTVGFQPLTSMEYFFQPDAQNITPVSFPGMYQGLCIDYRGGFETIPPDITLLANQVVADIYYARTRDPNVTSESLGDYSYAMADRMLMRRYYADLLAPYKRIPIAGGMG